jgi:hypothetical protein
MDWLPFQVDALPPDAHLPGQTGRDGRDQSLGRALGTQAFWVLVLW